MRRPHKLTASFCILICLSFIDGYLSMADEAKMKQAIGPASVWRPSVKVMDKIRQECANSSGQVFEECVVSAMAKSGASPEAVAFAKSSGNLAYIRDFQDTGRVDVAYVEYPFRANENQGILLVNGFPQIIDVDNLNVLPKGELQRDPLYVQLARKFPNISIWPGDRNSSKDISAETSPGGGQRFILGYRLLDGCHACQLLGYAKFAFQFDGLGNFTSIKLIGVESQIDKEKDSMSGAENGADRHLTETSGKQFSITLDSNPTTGYHWELVDLPNEDVVKLVGNAYRGPEATKLLGAGGKEIWTFKAVGRGEATIRMKYVRPWEKGAPPEKTAEFAVTVH